MLFVLGILRSREDPTRSVFAISARFSCNPEAGGERAGSRSDKVKGHFTFLTAANTQFRFQPFIGQMFSKEDILKLRSFSK